MSKKLEIGPAGYMPQSAPSMGVELSPEGKALLYGNIVEPEEAMRDAAKALLTRDNPTLFPGPQV
ncbi:MAG: 2-oxoglutarate:ferredoxin oxidoreductase, partial [Spirochaetota bacterium]|nr:2-oxoglutarate:ferredoxin oxidoreductase [Spirochaetota bacterium]